MKRFMSLTTAGAGLIAVLVLAAGADARAESLLLQGQARVEDNATLQIWGQRIRLEDIVTPDPKSPEGREGKRYLEKLVSAVTVRCVISAPLYRSAVPGRCFAGKIDIGESLITAGYAQERKQTGRR
jgi:endonuclease YncB( thermonuclease family)